MNFALKHAHVFPLAMGLSGNYDPTTWHAWGEQGDATYFNNPMAYVAQPRRRPPRLAARARRACCSSSARARSRCRPTGALPSTRALADLLASKGIRHELDVWGYDVPHDWSSWQAQLRHHLPRFC